MSAACGGRMGHELPAASVRGALHRQIVLYYKARMKGRYHSEPAERALDAADYLFYTQGYSATGVNQIISEANVARASFYQHYPSKKALALAYLRRRHQRWFAQLRARVEAATDARARLFALFEFLAAWLPATNYRGCAFLNIVAESPRLGADFQALVGRHKSELRDLIHALVAELDVPSPGPIADAVHLLCEGAIVESQVMRDAWPIQAAQEAVRRLIDR